MPKIEAKTIASFVSILQQRRPSILNPIPFIGRRIVEEVVKELDTKGFQISPSGLTANIAAMWLQAKGHSFTIEKIEGTFITYDLGSELSVETYDPYIRLQQLREKRA